MISELFQLILSFLYIAVFCFALAYLLKTRFEKALPITFFSGMLLHYVCGLLGTISIATCLIALADVLFLGYLIYFFIRKRKEALQYFKNCFSIGFFLFGILFLYIYILTRKYSYTFVDDYQHWGVMVREMVRLDRFYCIPESSLSIHKDYPPIFSLLETWGCLVFGEYKESTCFFSLILFEISLVFPLLSKKREFSIQNLFSSSFVLFLFILTGVSLKVSLSSDNTLPFNSLYADWPMAFVMGYVLYSISQKADTKTDFLNLLLSFSVLILSKQMGAAFYLLTLFYAFIKMFFFESKKDYRKFILLVLVPLAFYVSWKLVIAHYQLSGQFNVGDIRLEELSNIIGGTASENWKTETFHNFIDALFQRTLVYAPFKMTYFVYVLLIAGLLWVIGKIVKKNQMFLLSGIFVLGSVGYALGMLLLYIYCFDIYEGPALTCFNRYMLTYLFIGTVLVFMNALDCFMESKKITVILFSLVLLLFVNVDETNLLCFKTKEKWTINDVYRYVSESEESKVLIVDLYEADNSWTENARFRYYFENSEKEFSDVFLRTSLGSQRWEGQTTLELSEEDYPVFLSNYDYVYIYGSYDEDFYENYWSNFTDSELMNNGFYEIKTEEGHLNIAPLNE